MTKEKAIEQLSYAVTECDNEWGPNELDVAPWPSDGHGAIAGAYSPAAPSPDPGARPATADELVAPLFRPPVAARVLQVECSACKAQMPLGDWRKHSCAPSPSAVVAPAGLTTRGEGVCGGTDGRCPVCKADISGPLSEAYDAGKESVDG